MWFPLSIISQSGLGLASLIDKVILKNYLQQPVIFIFYIGVASLAALVVLPFGVVLPETPTLALAAFNGLLHLAAIYFMIKALFQEEASRALPFIGGLSPLSTLLIGAVFFNLSLNQQQMAGFFLIVGATFLLSSGLNRWGNKQTLYWAIFSSILFGLNNNIAKTIYSQIGFASGFFWMTMTQAAIAFLIIWPLAKNIIKDGTKKSGVKGGIIYWSNRTLAGFSSLGVSYAISLANPALVDSIQGMRYAAIFLGSIFLARFFPALLKENWETLILLRKFGALILIAGGLRLIA